MFQYKIGNNTSGGGKNFPLASWSFGQTYIRELGYALYQDHKAVVKSRYVYKFYILITKLNTKLLLLHTVANVLVLHTHR